MSFANFSLTWSTVRSLIEMILDIFIMWLLFYYALRLIRSNTRTVQIFKGILLIVVIDGLAKFFKLQTLAFVTDMFINWGFLALIIIFQPEIRSLLERIGKTNVFSRMSNLSGNEKENLVNQIVTAVMLLSKDQTGALISIEQSHSLEDFIETGTRLNSDVTAELLTSIFVTSTPLHDGAVIIQGNKIACASAYFPPTNMELPNRFGARHRAAIGISEITDAITIVVSEETGNVSLAENGRIWTVNRKELRDYLMRRICGYVMEVDPHAAEENSEILLPKKVSEPDSDERIQAEEVKPAEESEQEKAERIHEEADEEAEAAEIKLPHKRKRAKPSYPHEDHMEHPSNSGGDN